jgi:hypothetical protein
MMRNQTKAMAVLLLPILFILTPHATFSRQSQTPASNVKPGATKTKGADETASAHHEDFSALSLKNSGLKLELAVLGEKDDKPGTSFIRERWHLMWRDGDPIDVYVVKPRGVEKPPVVLYLYSYPQDTDRFKEDYWCRYATGGGFAAVGFVSALTGHRVENRAPKDNFFNQLPESLGASVHDVQMILNYLTSRNDLDMSRVGMFGQGSGGAIAILSSAVDPRIKALDVLTPWGDWPLFLAKSTFVPSDERPELNKPEFLKQVASLDSQQWFPNVKARSVRIQDVRHDGHMPDEAQVLMETAAPQTAEIDQFGDGAALVPAASNGRVFDWIKSQLQPDSKPASTVDASQRIHIYPGKMPSNSLSQTP